jgi:hypothetical protein
MSGPIKARIINSLKRLEKIETNFVDNPDPSKSNLENMVILEANYEAANNEATQCQDCFNEIEAAETQWADLLRKMTPEEREKADKECEKFHKDDNYSKRRETAEFK